MITEAWGTTLKNLENIKFVSNEPKPLPEVLISEKFKSAVETVVANRLKNLTKSLEKDIEYFNTYKNQGMAINKFSMIKQELLVLIDTLLSTELHM